MKSENRQLLVLTHLSQLLDIVTGFGGFIVPLVLWLTQRDTIINMDENGKWKIDNQFSNKYVFIYPNLYSLDFTFWFGNIRDYRSGHSLLCVSHY